MFLPYSICLLHGLLYISRRIETNSEQHRRDLTSYETFFVYSFFWLNKLLFNFSSLLYFFGAPKKGLQPCNAFKFNKTTYFYNGSFNSQSLVRILGLIKILFSLFIEQQLCVNIKYYAQAIHKRKKSKDKERFMQVVHKLWCCAFLLKKDCSEVMCAVPQRISLPNFVFVWVLPVQNTWFCFDHVSLTFFGNAVRKIEVQSSNVTQTHIAVRLG